MIKNIYLVFLLSLFVLSCKENNNSGLQFEKNWKFIIGDIEGAEQPPFDDKSWRTVDLPHDWSIEGIAQSDNDENIPEYNIVKGDWKFSKGDTMLWSKPDLNDKSWQTVKLPANWETHSNYTYKASERKAFHGLCLAVVQSKTESGKIYVSAESDGLEAAEVVIQVKK